MPTRARKHALMNVLLDAFRRIIKNGSREQPFANYTASMTILKPGIYYSRLLLKKLRVLTYTSAVPRSPKEILAFGRNYSYLPSL